MFSPLRFHIINTKISPQVIQDLYSAAENNGASIVPSPDTADVILTDIHARKRLARHLDLERLTANNTTVVSSQWLLDSAAQRKALPYDDYLALKGSLSSTSPSIDSQASVNDIPSLDRLHLQSSRRLSLSTPTPVSPTSAKSTVSTRPSTPSSISREYHLLSDTSPLRQSQVRQATDNSRFAVHRLSPATCQNQTLVQQLNVLVKSRTLDGNTSSALSYSRAISVLKAYPHAITNSKQVAHLTGIGQKIGSMIDELLETGKIQEVEENANSHRFQTLSIFSSVYSIGPAKARYFYDDLGIHSLQELEEHADQLPDDEPMILNLRIALGYREDFEKKLSREQAEEIARVVGDHLNVLAPGSQYTICGGYRRGRTTMTDVDIIATHPDIQVFKGLCGRLTKRLQDVGIVSHLFHLSSFTSTHGAVRSRKFGGGRTTNFDSLDKALTAFRVPSGYEATEKESNSSERPSARPIGSDSDVSMNEVRSGDDGPLPKAIFAEDAPYRRVDLVFAPPEAYWTAVVGWTGSTQFERDIRLWANEKGLHFDSTGICRLNDSKPLYADSEQDVFDILSLPYVPPEYRNADA